MFESAFIEVFQRDIVYAFLFLLLSFVEYNFYIKWRKFKKEVNKSSELEDKDYRLVGAYWTIIIVTAVISVIYFFR